MSSVFGTSNNYFNYFFNTSDNNNSSSSGIFGSTSSMLGDYSLIKSGSYKKLLTAYYKTYDADGKEKSTTDSDAEGDSTGKLLNVKSDAGALKEAADALNTASLYETKKDEEGKDVYDMDAIKKSVKNFVSAYNDYLDSAGDVESTSILSKTLSVVKKTSANQNLLKEVGITIGKDNKLTLDEEKLEKAHVTTLSSLFKGYGSFGSSISQKASETYKVANSAAYTNTRASSYTYNGAYSILGTSNGILDKYL